MGNTWTFSVPTLCEWEWEERDKAGVKACRGCNHCPAVFCSAVLDQLYQSVLNKVSACEPASVQRWLAAGPWWWWRLISQYTVDRCHTGTKASGGKCCGLLCVCVCAVHLPTTFLFPLLSSVLPYPSTSSQRAARCHPRISLLLSLWHGIKPNKTEQIWPQRASQGAESCCSCRSGVWILSPQAFTLMGHT